MSTNIHLESPLGEVPHEWRFDYLRNLVFKIGSGATPRGGDSTYLARRENFALVRSQNVFDRHFDDIGLAYISDEQARQLRGVQLSPNDVLLNITGDGITFARACIVPEHVLPACVNQHVSIIRTDPDVCSPGYLLAYLTHPAIKSYIESFNAGGSRRAITKGHIESLVVPLPPLHVQRAIAAILSGFDDKIDLNRRMNATLEATARALFQSWFVDFDPVRAKAEGRQPEGMDAETAALFPDSFVDSALEEIPRGWRVGLIGDIASIFGSPVNPLKSPNELFWHYSLPAFDEGHMPKLEFGAAIKSNKNLVHEDAVLLSKLNPQHLKVWVPMPYHDHRSLASTEFLPVIGRDGISREYLYGLFNSENFVRVFANLVTGTSSSHQRVKPEYFLGMDTVIPSLSVIKRFTDLAESFHLQVITQQEESRTLAETRDALLPRLISGEVRVGDWQDEFSEVIE
jgi:type I restriction enzyme, S subunit